SLPGRRARARASWATSSRACGDGLRDRGGRGVATGEHAPVDWQGRACDPARSVARVEEDRLDDVLWVAVAAERVEAVDRLEYLARLLWAHEPFVRRRLDKCQRNRVDADSVQRELDR